MLIPPPLPRRPPPPAPLPTLPSPTPISDSSGLFDVARLDASGRLSSRTLIRATGRGTMTGSQREGPQLIVGEEPGWLEHVATRFGTALLAADDAPEAAADSDQGTRP